MDDYDELEGLMIESVKATNKAIKVVEANLLERVKLYNFEEGKIVLCNKPLKVWQDTLGGKQVVLDNDDSCTIISGPFVMGIPHSLSKSLIFNCVIILLHNKTNSRVIYEELLDLQTCKLTGLRLYP